MALSFHLGVLVCLPAPFVIEDSRLNASKSVMNQPDTLVLLLVLFICRPSYKEGL